MAIAEAAERIPALPRRIMSAVSGDRQLCLNGARVLPHHPATGRCCLAVLARYDLIGPAVQLRQTPLPRRSGRSRRPSTAMEQWAGRRACPPPQAHQAFHVRPRQLRSATSARHLCCITSTTQNPTEDFQLIHQMCGRTTFAPPRHATTAAQRGLFLLRRVHRFDRNQPQRLDRIPSSESQRYPFRRTP